MRLDKISLKNYRCYEDIEILFHPSFNILVGINGTGKTAMLEAVRIAIGSLYCEFDKVENKISSPSISENDVRLHNSEMQYEVHINSSIIVDPSLYKSSTISWGRYVERYGGSTKYERPKFIKEFSKEIQRIIRAGENKTIPLIAYYSTDRYKKEKKNTGLEADGSRLRGYYNALDSLTNIWFFLNIYKTETLWELQHGEKSPLLSAVNRAVQMCVYDCVNIYHDIKKDKLIIQLRNGEMIPFHMLSDGVRNVLAMVMEIAFRCHLLNPHLGEEASIKTNGVVLIDEIDLHLHPEWQKKIVNDFVKAFPSIQFIVTTHAPLVIGALKEGKIVSITDRKIHSFPIQYGKDANTILNEMGTIEMDDEIKSKLNEYFLLIEEGKGRLDCGLMLRIQLEQILGKEHTEMQRADTMLNLFD